MVRFFTLVKTHSYIRPIVICCLLHRLGSLLAKLCFEAVINPVSVADKTKSDDFELRPDVGLVRDVFTFLF